MPQFKFSLLSDMHVDFPQPKTPYHLLEEFVVVAGDTSNGLEGLKFLNKMKRKGHDVFAVDGNHEHYSNRTQGRDHSITEDRFYYGLDQQNHRVLTNGLLIVGTNGWYPVSDEHLWQSYMNDSYNSMLSADEVNTLAGQDAFLVKHLLEQYSKNKAIVVTHTAPCPDTLNPEYDGHYSNEWYWNPMMKDVLRDHADQILVWVHGHTHKGADKVIDGVRVVCNPRGYPRENEGWVPKTVEVEW